MPSTCGQPASKTGLSRGLRALVYALLWVVQAAQAQVGNALTMTASLSDDLSPYTQAGEFSSQSYGAAVNSAAGKQVFRPLLVSVVINGGVQAETALLRDGTGRWLAAKEDLEAWTLNTPNPPPDTIFRGQPFYYVDRYSGQVPRFDAVQQRVEFEFAAEAFKGGVVRLNNRRMSVAAPAGYGLYLNYDLAAIGAESSRQTNPGGSQDPRLGMIGELVAYAPLGRFEGTFSVTDLMHQREALAGQPRYLRNSTAFIADFQQQRTSLTLGDAYGVSGYWGRPARFGGVRYGTNFSTQPGYLTSPVLAFAGQSTTPSVLELFINGNSSQRFNVPAGPFALNEIPVFGGQGEAQLVVTDALGRQQVFSQSFLTTGRQLREGLADFSLEAGRMRDFSRGDYNRYQGTIGVAQLRYGVSNRVTGELRAEAQNGLQVAGFGATVGSPMLGSYSLSMAVSQSNVGTGNLLYAAAEKTVGKRFSLSASAQWNSQAFRQLGSQSFAREGGLPYRTWATSASTSLGSGFSVSTGYAQQILRQQEKSTIASVTLNKSFGPLFTSLNASSVRGAFAGTSAFFTAGLSFGGSVSSSVTASRSKPEAGMGASNVSAQVQYSLGGNEVGYGWRAQSNRTTVDGGAQTTGYDAGGFYRGNYGSYLAEAGYRQQTTSWRLGAAGAVGLLGDVLFASRPVTRSLAVLEAPNLAGLPIIVNSQRSGVLNTKGRLVLPQLSPYVENTIRVDLSNADYEISIKDPEMRFVPGNRTGHKIMFDAQRVNGVVLRLVTADGKTPLPPGTRVVASGGTEVFYVADLGEAYITTTETQTVQLEIDRDGVQCRQQIRLPKPSDTLPTVGPLSCAAFKP